MRLLIEDLKRRKPFRVGVAYFVAASLLLVAAQLVLPLAGAPEWAINLLAAVVVLPFPFVVIFVWALSAQPPENVKVRGSRRMQELARRMRPR